MSVVRACSRAVWDVSVGGMVLDSFDCVPWCRGAPALPY